MRRVILTLAIVVGALAASSGIASADPTDYVANPGRQQAESVSCNSGHGAFQFFQGMPGYIGESARTGGSNGEPGIGDTTGPANSGFAAGCRAQ